MKKYIPLIILSIFAITVGVFATVDFNSDFTAVLPNGSMVTILNGSTAEQVILEDDSSIIVNYSSTTDFTIRSDDGYDITYLVTVGSSSNITTTETCITAGNELHIVASDLGQLIIVLDTGAVCTIPTPPAPPSPPGGGGGGGGGGSLPHPARSEIDINNGAESTNSLKVHLHITGTRMLGIYAPLQMVVSNTESFSGNDWQDYKEFIDWELSSGTGIKKVYVRLRNKWGVGSLAYDEIEYKSGQILGEKITGDFNLIKTNNHPAIYHLDDDNYRHLFVNEATFWTWHSGTWTDQDIRTVSQNDFDSYKVGENITAKPGVNLLKFENSQKVFDITTRDTLNVKPVLDWIRNDDEGQTKYGSGWQGKIIPIEVGFEDDYSQRVNDQPFNASIYSSGRFNLIKVAHDDAIYHLENGVRYLFPNAATFWTWHSGDWADQNVKVVSQAEFDNYKVGKNITVKPAAKLIKFDNSERIYGVSFNFNNDKRVINLLDGEETLTLTYGANWREKLIIIENSFEADYQRRHEIN